MNAERAGWADWWRGALGNIGAGVYFFYCPELMLAYVGQSTNLPWRLAEHLTGGVIGSMPLMVAHSNADMRLRCAVAVGLPKCANDDKDKRLALRCLERIVSWRVRGAGLNLLNRDDGSQLDAMQIECLAPPLLRDCLDRVPYLSPFMEI